MNVKIIKGFGLKVISRIKMREQTLLQVANASLIKTHEKSTFLKKRNAFKTRKKSRQATGYCWSATSVSSFIFVYNILDTNVKKKK